jgi:uncharacterized heparinase superfamily protein
MTVLRYFHTLRHLRAGQIVGRLRHRLYHPRPDLREPPARRALAGPWCTQALREPTMLGPAHFQFLNDARQLQFPGAWNASQISLLWVYNLHYFEDLNATGGESRRAWHEALIERWIQDNPPARGVGWEPYPLSLRIVNWIKWALAGGDLTADAVHSLAIQARQLRRRLEFHLLGNHLFENAKALVFAGLFFEGDEAREWLRTGTRLLDEQIEEQILADGGHFELSPMYHALLLEGMLDLVNVCTAYGHGIPPAWPAAVARMVDWAAFMNHPDSGIAFFNDAAFAIAPDLAAIAGYAARLGLPASPPPLRTRLLESSGYARLEAGPAVVLADVAPVGPDYLPGHAHADTLSFELSLGGRRVLVNSGTSVYGVGEERQRQRGTAAHNTVRIDGVDSSDVWAGFRVGRRARVRVEHFEALPTPVLQAAHDGYYHLAGRPGHRRRWAVGPGELRVDDAIDGRGDHLVEAFFHVHPDFHLQAQGPSTFTAVHKSGETRLTLDLDSRLHWEVRPGSWHPGFGLRLENACLHGTYQGALPVNFVSRFGWGG